jgi:hypothetical protein
LREKERRNPRLPQTQNRILDPSHFVRYANGNTWDMIGDVFETWIERKNPPQQVHISSEEPEAGDETMYVIFTYIPKNSK